MTFYLDSANAMFANVEELRARRVEWTRWFLIFKFDVKLSKFPSANLAPKIELKWAKNIEHRGQGGGYPHRTLGPKMDQISILGALVALGLSS